jgi:hypothetical protein
VGRSVGEGEEDNIGKNEWRKKLMGNGVNGSKSGKIGEGVYSGKSE